MSSTQGQGFQQCASTLDTILGLLKPAWCSEQSSLKDDQRIVGARRL